MNRPLGQEQVDRLLVTARSRGWREAIERECTSLLQLHRYAADPREGDCLHLLPEIGQRRALFLGNALGILPFILAERFELVVVVDRDPRRLAFARHRQQEEHVNNLMCLSADVADTLTSRCGRFDLVALGDEYPQATFSVPFADPHTPSRLARLTAPEGCLMYGVRFGLLAAAVKRLSPPWKVGAPASYPAHVRLLHEATFASVRAYWRNPDGRPYQAYIPLDTPSIVDHWLEHAARLPGIRGRMNGTMVSVAHRLGFLPHVVDNFVVIARRA
jgi:hypothetical protein